jgi:hypothetical protein
LWDGSGSGFRTRTGGEKPAHRESGNAGNGSSRTLPSSFSLGEVGGDPLLLSPGWASCPVSSRNAAPLRPTRSRSRRAADQSPQRPHFNASRPPAQLVRFVASIPKAAAISFDASNQLWMRSRDGVVHHTRADAEADNEHFNGLAHHRPPRLFRTAVDEWKDARTRVTGRYPDHRALP